MKIYCKYDKLESLYNLKAHPKNPNKHSTDQVKRLAELYNYHGIRHPVIVSNLSGFVVAGHGRIEAAKQAGLKEFPIVYQDFVDTDAEYAFMVSDNAISDWSELDMGMINADLPDLGPDFDIDMLGMKDFNLDVFEKKDSEEITIDFKYKIEIDCINEENQKNLKEEFEKRGFEVRLLL